jgi:hypothetical protein
MEISDADGNIVDENQPIRWDDADDLICTAIGWELREASLVAVGADASAMVRSLDGTCDNTDIATMRATMWSRQRMHERSQALIGNHYE